MSVVIYSEVNGVYLGECLGLGFWSKLDAVGQPSAVTFPSEEEARTYMAEWSDEAPPDIVLVPVLPDDGDYASTAACMRAGLPAWLVEDTPTENALPL